MGGLGVLDYLVSEDGSDGLYLELHGFPIY